MEIDDFCVGKWNNYGSTMSVDGKYAQRLRDIDMANKIDRKKIINIQKILHQPLLIILEW